MRTYLRLITLFECARLRSECYEGCFDIVRRVTSILAASETANDQVWHNDAPLAHKPLSRRSAALTGTNRCCAQVLKLVVFVRAQLPKHAVSLGLDDIAAKQTFSLGRIGGTKGTCGLEGGRWTRLLFNPQRKTTTPCLPPKPVLNNYHPGQTARQIRLEFLLHALEIEPCKGF